MVSRRIHETMNLTLSDLFKTHVHINIEVPKNE